MTNTDFDLLNRLKPLSFLSAGQVRKLANGVYAKHFTRVRLFFPKKRWRWMFIPAEGHREDHLPEPLGRARNGSSACTYV